MQTASPFSWRNDFARSADAERYREIVRRVQDEARREDKHRRDRERDKEKRDEQRSDVDDLIDAAVMVMASSSEIAAFQITLNHYDEATYDALIENGRLLDLLQREREEILADAHVLEDGTRVFESEDGVRVFDEHGNELDASIITADQIEDWRPSAERYFENGDALAMRNAEREALVAYQERLDEARELVEDGEMTVADLRTLERELAEEMPEAIREQLPEEHRPALDNVEADAPMLDQDAVLTATAAPILTPPTF